MTTRMFSKTAGIVVPVFFLSLLLAAEPAGKPLAVRHSSTDDTATIQIGGLEKPLVVLQHHPLHIRERRQERFRKLRRPVVGMGDRPQFRD